MSTGGLVPCDLIMPFQTNMLLVFFLMLVREGKSQHFEAMFYNGFTQNILLPHKCVSVMCFTLSRTFFQALFLVHIVFKLF